MKGVIIAGGTGSRLMPLTKVVNKNILAIYDKPLIYYPILTLRDAGIEDILIISGRGHAGQYLDLLGSGQELGAHISYEIQEVPGGIAQAIALARRFCDGERFVALLGDNILEDRLGPAVREFEAQKTGAKVMLKQVADPERFGVARIEDGRIVEILEKPSDPPSNLIVTGTYMYDERAFELIGSIKPSARGELEVTDLNNCYVREGCMTFAELQGEWIDAGTFDSLLYANNYVANNIDKMPQFKTR